MIKWLLISFVLAAGFLLLCWGLVLLSCSVWDSLKSRGRLPMFLLRRTGSTDEYARPGKRDIPMQIHELTSEGRGYSLSRIEIREEAFAGLTDKSRKRAVEGIAYGVIPGTIRSRDRTAQSGRSEFQVLFPDTDSDGARKAVLRIQKKIAAFLERSGVPAPAERFMRNDTEFTPGRMVKRPDDRHLRGFVRRT